jgi:hypothetical protein
MQAPSDSQTEVCSANVPADEFNNEFTELDAATYIFQDLQLKGPFEEGEELASRLRELFGDEQLERKCEVPEIVRCIFGSYLGSNDSTFVYVI